MLLRFFASHIWFWVFVSALEFSQFCFSHFLNILYHHSWKLGIEEEKHTGRSIVSSKHKMDPWKTSAKHLNQVNWKRDSTFSALCFCTHIYIPCKRLKKSAWGKWPSLYCTPFWKYRTRSHSYIIRVAPVLSEEKVLTDKGLKRRELLVDKSVWTLC